MKQIQFNCPACGERGQAPAELLGQAVKCPTCAREFVATADKLRPSGLGWTLLCAGFLLWLIGHSSTGFEFPEVMRLLMYCGAVLFGVGLAVICWKSREWMMAGGLVFFALGAGVFGVCALLNLIDGIIIGGFIAVIGAIFLTRN